MSEPTSRQALEEALAFADSGKTALQSTEPIAHLEAMYRAARAILDAPPVEWCETHWSPQLRVNPTECQMRPYVEDDIPCQFQTYVRVKVAL